MTGEPTPARRRLVGTALRRYRENVGYALEDAAQVLECDRSKISRIETGQRGIRPKELRELLTEYGVPVSEQLALLAIVGRGGAATSAAGGITTRTCCPRPTWTTSSWSRPHRRSWSTRPSSCPTCCRPMTTPPRWPGAEPGLTAEQREDTVAAKAVRRQAVLGGPSASAAPRLTVVLGEGALHQAVGGPPILAAQIRHLIELSTDVPGDHDPGAAVLRGRARGPLAADHSRSSGSPTRPASESSTWRRYPAGSTWRARTTWPAISEPSRCCGRPRSAPRTA